MESTIKWISFAEKKPTRSGWYLYSSTNISRIEISYYDVKYEKWYEDMDGTEDIGAIGCYAWALLPKMAVKALF